MFPVGKGFVYLDSALLDGSPVKCLSHAESFLRDICGQNGTYGVFDDIVVGGNVGL